MQPTFAPARSLSTLSRATVLALAALALNACPGETGRQRGPVTDGGPLVPLCPSFSPGSSGCLSEGQICRYTSMAGCMGGVRAEVCECSRAGRWACTPGPCTVPRPDSGDACPLSSLVSSGDSCGISLAGITCMGEGLDCAGNTVTVPCYCGGTNWSCQQPFCPDASPPDEGAFEAGAPDPRCPEEAQPGRMCGAEAFECRYPAGPACELTCRCEEGAFLCEQRCMDTPDGGLDAAPSD